MDEKKNKHTQITGGNWATAKGGSIIPLRTY